MDNSILTITDPRVFLENNPDNNTWSENQVKIIKKFLKDSLETYRDSMSYEDLLLYAKIFNMLKPTMSVWERISSRSKANKAPVKEKAFIALLHKIPEEFHEIKD